MSEPVLTTLTRTQGANEALKNGSVSPAGFSLLFTEIPVLVHGFRRMVRNLEFDVSEMALTTYLTAREHGVAFTALPIFLVRGFHHGAIRYNTRSSIREPKDLEGRRVGVNRGYTVTTGVWARGILAAQYGVDLDRVTWVLSGDEHVETYVPPANVVPAPPGTHLRDMLIRGELDAVIGVDVDHPDVAPLISEPDDAAAESLRDHAFYPINHLVVVKDEVLQRYPDVAPALIDAFTEAKQQYVTRLRDGEITSDADRMYARVLEITGTDPLPYGLEANRAMLEQLIDFALAQRILTKPVDIDEVFTG
ncbi:ABC transporter substrate-binding protein [Mycolicibacterium wolinskyi]|uniref:4,5-dihydroxyphthalate decarboxylase n=1 Tax=Mycolicibacterium wolinskyi TaxID=59750 RepID=A0A1X2EY36_9MYCO|nr:MULTISPECIES: ABC transporter substrate-binding protein [Mycolicibacterium]MCV7286206.1 ABC transporter substrate-binding protein [Mycolicibacterium wolinskyi]MCV7293186.1 ABC transporter substrate-binding protein [Mycolicibacterium goodii]ORX10689.1 4,5-dihydroxyphthalate decarboxylase [Mycolicibacterium wolinskyi]